MAEQETPALCPAEPDNVRQHQALPWLTSPLPGKLVSSLRIRGAQGRSVDVGSRAQDTPGLHLCHPHSILPADTCPERPDGSIGGVSLDTLAQSTSASTQAPLGGAALGEHVPQPLLPLSGCPGDTVLGWCPMSFAPTH